MKGRGVKTVLTCLSVPHVVNHFHFCRPRYGKEEIICRVIRMASREWAFSRQSSRCVLKELESLGKELYGAKLIAQRFQVRNCSHFKDPVSGSACLLSMTEEGNPHHYFIATQDQDLATKVKKKAGVPLLFIIQNTMVLDKPSPKSLAFVQAMQANQLVPEHQKQSIEHLKEEQGLVKESENRRKRKRASGPNPLSCLKKKKKVQETQQPSAAKKKRKRKRNRAKSEAKAVSVQLSVKA
ncbi:rRNA-processing protein UTP23 homolog isoform X3 [Mauremys reevesii]|uniref:rRNA-processing protein UTP23 homolog isoform X3 n=1 Tax=Mauremys reevesii TaxID=260615 RepID=UPI00193FC8A1|nr:rRNA-processing protein UTP23 homolog isoform X3 [Mauremys reevesii]